MSSNATAGTEDPRTKGAIEVADQKPISYPGVERQMTPTADHGEISYKGHGRLKDKVALITGGDSGIGRAVAIAFAREGADVVLSYLNEHEDAGETENWVRSSGQRALLIPGDIQQEEHCSQLIERTLREFGHLDILVNNAAFQCEHESIQDLTTADFERTFRTNVFATFWLSKAALSKMRAGSVIVNTSSVQAYNPSPGLLAYAPTKAAIVSFTKALAQAAMKQGVRVNAVAPGPVWTPLIASTLTEEHIHRFGQGTSLERPAQPAEIAPLYVFLASDDASYISGEVYAATGGKTPY